MTNKIDSDWFEKRLQTFHVLQLAMASVGHFTVEALMNQMKDQNYVIDFPALSKLKDLYEY